MEMIWEQKLAALQALTETSLKMRAPGDWYVSANGRALVDGMMLVSEYGNGKTPEEAVIDDWKKMSVAGSIAIVGGINDGKRFRWTGFMWTEAMRP